MSEVTGQGLQELATQMEQGIDPYAVIGKLYVRVLAKDQALSLAIQALRALMPEETQKEPAPPQDPAAPEPTPDPIPGPVSGAAKRRHTKK